MKYTISVDNKLDAKQTISELRKEIALQAYLSGECSVGYCAELSGMFYADFIKFLGEHNISIFALTKEDIENDIKNA